MDGWTASLEKDVERVLRAFAYHSNKCPQFIIDPRGRICYLRNSANSKRNARVQCQHTAILISDIRESPWDDDHGGLCYHWNVIK